MCELVRTFLLDESDWLTVLRRNRLTRFAVSKAWALEVPVLGLFLLDFVSVKINIYLSRLSTSFNNRNFWPNYPIIYVVQVNSKRRNVPPARHISARRYINTQTWLHLLQWYELSREFFCIPEGLYPQNPIFSFTHKVVLVRSVAIYWLKIQKMVKIKKIRKFSRNIPQSQTFIPT